MRLQRLPGYGSIAVAAMVSTIVYRDLFLSTCTLKKGLLLKTITKTIPSVQPTNSTGLFYNHAPNVFIEEFTECLFDRRYCNVLYWHIPKTGGSYIASRMIPLFNLEPYNSKEWCCNNNFMADRFRSDIAGYCSKRMGVYEVRSHEYQEVLRTCQDFRRNQLRNDTSETTGRQHRYIGFVSVREPIQRSLSAVHQTCNVHQSSLRQEVRETCERCNYHVDDDKPFFEKYVNQTNNFYTGLKDLLIIRSNSDGGGDIPLYVIDNDDINDMFQQLEYAVNRRFKKDRSNMTFHFPPGKKNSEATAKLCDFGMPSSLMKQHQPALDAYHSIWSNSNYPSQPPDFTRGVEIEN